MASFNNFYIAVTFLISFTFLLKTSVCSENLQPPSRGPSSELNYAPRPSSSYEKYLSNCATKLTPSCGQQVYFGVFVGNQTVSNKCCAGLVHDVGKSCHMDITNNAIKLPTFQKSKTVILNRALKVWNDCNSVQSPSSELNYAPRPSSSYEKYLSKCATKLTPNCGQQVYFGVFVGNQTVSNKCCQGLVNDVGKSCHMDITNNAIKLPTFQNSKTVILNRALKIWNDCSSAQSSP